MKQHFRSIAEMLHETREKELPRQTPSEAVSRRAIVDFIAEQLCPIFSRMDNNFDADTFLPVVKEGFARGKGART